MLRVYDRALGAAVAQRFGFEYVRSTVELATPWFIGAAMGLQVLGTFSVRQRSFMVGGVRVESCSELDGMRMVDLSTQTRVIAIVRGGEAVKSHPRRDTRLIAGDTAYLVGPYRELLDTLRKGQGAQQSDVSTIQRRQVETRAGGIRHRGQPAVGRVLGAAHHGAAVLLDERHRLVDVVGTQEDREQLPLASCSR